MTSAPDQQFAVGKKLKDTMWLSGATVATVTLASLEEARVKTEKSLGSETKLGLIKCVREDSETIIAVVGQPPSRFIGAYEVGDYADGVPVALDSAASRFHAGLTYATLAGILLKRICDVVVTGLIASFGKLPMTGFSGKYEPLQGNEFAGSKVFPSGLSPNNIINLVEA